MEETLLLAAFVQRPRVIVLTDISSLTSGVREPDDGQSLIRLMLYTNDLDVEGLIASSNLGHGQVVRPELIHAVVDAYAQVRPNLLLHSDRYHPPRRCTHGYGQDSRSQDRRCRWRPVSETARTPMRHAGSSRWWTGLIPGRCG